MRVRAPYVHIFKGPKTSTRSWGVLKKGSKFWTDRRDRPYLRYHVRVKKGKDGWITSNPRKVRPCKPSW
ncbi:hypothetical protein ETD83_10790 [Actinomadura soli]|uniref:Uncharacterized protein n=2 Tax=Actinomadura soli TaxID=2508997 RepID=A0A5C4JFK6_9ACTN|nr:hypothetical protein ETD83_10790 [Actinomadura soli]